MTIHCLLVSHTHWDREWYRTFQAFRARLVDAVDRILALVADDPGYVFVLDGQSIVLEDYLEIRPDRRADLEAACRSGRVAIGPWYVQPDSFLPSGEAHVRNLLEGRRVAAAFGPVSRIAYCADSFGHPAQLPQLFRGFGLEAFIYWRGNGDEIDALSNEYVWVAPDGSAILACHLARGYFAAGGLPADVDDAVARLRPLAEELAGRSRGRALLMNGFDHLLPDPHVGTVADALARATGWTVRRGRLEDFVADVATDDLARFSGELRGGRVANLLPGVWSARLPLKLRNRRAEAVLEGWAEPWAALGHVVGTPDERAALRLAWRALLQNQAHDSIGGCSQDDVHAQMETRYDTAEELARETTTRVLERIAGLGPERGIPWDTTFDVAVFNPSPHARTDVVRLPLDAVPPWHPGAGEFRIHPLVLANVEPGGFTVDGRRARLVPAEGNRRMRVVPHQQDWELELVVADVPAFGFRRLRIAPGAASPDEEDDGRTIAADDVAVEAAAGGTLTVRFGKTVFTGIGALEGVGDRGDAYDFDPAGAPETVTGPVSIRRRRHANGVQELVVERTLAVPTGLQDDRERRTAEQVALRAIIEARVAPGVPRVDLRVRLDNTAADHRLRLLFPTGAAVDRFVAASTFDAYERSTAIPDAAHWVHPAPTTFPHQGWISAGGLTVAAPGLPEAEVTPTGTIAITLVRAVGWMNQFGLRARPLPAGPSMAIPGAQCRGTIDARLALFPALDPGAVRDTELGLRAVAAGDRPLVAEGASLLALAPATLVLSALKPADDGDGLIVRVLNPTAAPVDAVVRCGFPLAAAIPVRLDETPADEPVARDGHTIAFVVPPHALRSTRLRPARTHPQL